MTQEFYQEVKTLFDADATLVPSPFDEMYSGEGPEVTDDNVPICVLEPDPDVATERSYNSIYKTLRFTFRVHDKTLELVGPHLTLIKTAFQDPVASLSVSGMQIMRWDEEDSGDRQGEEDRWEAWVTYEVLFRKAR